MGSRIRRIARKASQNQKCEVCSVKNSSVQLKRWKGNKLLMCGECVLAANRMVNSPSPSTVEAAEREINLRRDEEEGKENKDERLY